MSHAGIAGMLQVDAAIHLDDLLEKVEDTSPSELIAALFELEMLGLVKQLRERTLLKCGNVNWVICNHT